GRSINSITAQITEEVGWDKVVETAHRLGIESPLQSVPSVSLGPNDVSVFEMVKAYSTFLNEGKLIDPILVTTIRDRDGNVIAEVKPKEKEVLSKENAWLMLYMLRGTMEEPGGTSQALWEWDLWKKNNQIAGKTGTSSDYVDGWYMGMTNNLVTGVWVVTTNVAFTSKVPRPVKGRIRRCLYSGNLWKSYIRMKIVVILTDHFRILR